MARGNEPIRPRGKALLEQFRSSGIGLRVLVSAFFGITMIPASLFVAFTVYAALQGNLTEIDLDEISPILLVVAPIVQGLVLLAFTSPLIVIAFGVALVFRTSIEKCPAVWSVVACVSVWVFICALFSLQSESAFYPPFSKLKQFLWILGQRENLLFLLGPIPSAVIFYYLTISRRDGPSPGLATDRA